MPECSEIGLMLGAAGDGELEPSSMREISSHLTQCATCKTELSDYATIGRELKAIAVAPSLEGFTKSVLDLIATLVAVALLILALRFGAVRPNIVNVAHAVPETVASKPLAPAPIKMFDVRVDSAIVADEGTGAFVHTNARTESGKMLVFSLPGGKTLHVQPRAIDGDMIRMEVVLFDGDRATMTVDLNLENGSTLALGGEQFAEGTLLLRISPSTASVVSLRPNLL
ncbi:MAG: zf-HC2 domain-containing protein [Candidatus Binatus sp.]